MQTLTSSRSATVHILLCTHNGAPWLRAQLESLLVQSYTDWQLWISDDCSNDETLLILAEFAHDNPGRVAAMLNGPGKGYAANFLSLLCHPDLPPAHVALCDQDDIWLPHKLEHAMAQLCTLADQPCAWSGRYVFTNAKMQPLGVSPVWPRGPSLENALVQNIMSGHTLTLNPAALRLVRRAGPVQVSHHDWWIYLLLMACNAHALIDTEVVLHYRQHDKNTIGKRAGLWARSQRLTAVLNGTLRDWISTNLAALSQADLPLSPKAQRLIALHNQAQGAGLDHMFENFAFHRQNLTETLALSLAKRLGRL